MLKSSDGLYKKIISSKIIGLGTTAIVFKTKENKTLKYYLNTERKRMVFQNNDMLNRFSLFSELQIKNIYTPQDIYIKAYEVVAYDYNYIEGHPLGKSIPDISLELFLEYLKQIYESICILSKYHIYSRDFHRNNVIINKDGINIFDVDQYEVTLFNEGICRQHNLDVILHEILYYVFLLREGASYKDEELNKLVMKFLSSCGTYEDDIALLKYLCYIFNPKEISIKKLSKEIKRYEIK